jgi:hypothetical protein
MEVSFSSAFGQPLETHFAVDPGQQIKMMPMRQLNGQWPYLPPGIDRDTTWSQQGTTGRLEKNGAVLTSEPGYKAYLICDPRSGGVIAYNPLPDPQAWSLDDAGRRALQGRRQGRPAAARIPAVVARGRDRYAEPTRRRRSGQAADHLRTCARPARDREWPRAG